MEKLFQGTLSVWSGCVYAQARPFTYEDFEFLDLSVSKKGGTSKYASVTKAFRLKQEVLDEVVSESCLSIGKGFFMEWDKIKNHYIYVTQDIKYNGCRTLASKVAKYDKACAEVIYRWNEIGDSLVEKRIEEINEGFQRLLSRSREDYLQRYTEFLSNLRGYEQAELIEESGTASDILMLDEMGKAVMALERSINSRKYACLLESFELPDKGEWIDELPTELTEQVILNLRKSVDNPAPEFRGVLT